MMIGEEKRKINTCYNFDKEIGCVQDVCRCEQEKPTLKHIEYCHNIAMESLVKEVKQETFEEAYLNQLIDEANKEFTLDKKLAKDVAIKYANWQKEQDKNKYSEEDILINIELAIIQGLTLGEYRDLLIEKFKKK
jgi:hypothetical protein